ncbi:MAG: hypothetical protein NTW86_04800 [Candidatus Sumerlaeota bacterium]|nr:hypothetical protein [Candidatus Sumerlaeota bacterium]
MRSVARRCSSPRIDWRLACFAFGAVYFFAAGAARACPPEPIEEDPAILYYGQKVHGLTLNVAYNASTPMSLKDYCARVPFLETSLFEDVDSEISWNLGLQTQGPPPLSSSGAGEGDG